VRIAEETLVLAATDLSNFLACQHRMGMDLAAATGKIAVPVTPLDAALKLLREKGAAHERAYVDHLRAQGLTVVEISTDALPDMRVTKTLDALKSGPDVVYQGAFKGQGWIGYADVLRKVQCATGTRSSFGDFYYEPYDMKLARETKGGTILQLALYADLLAEVQGFPPERFFVVTPGKDFIVQEYRLAEYAAYFRMVRAQMLKALAKGPDALLSESYPEPVEHCDVCRWWDPCNKRRRDDDHLSFIAGVDCLSALSWYRRASRPWGRGRDVRSHHFQAVPRCGGNVPPHWGAGSGAAPAADKERTGLQRAADHPRRGTLSPA
jgi:uncharacterized protein